MADLSAFPITRKWPPENPDVIQLYAFPTPNGVKASIALEEMGLPYEPHRVPLGDEYVKSPEFLSLNPNNKIPAIIDPDGPGGEPIGLWESGAILQYLAEKSGKLRGATDRDRHHVSQWLFWQIGGPGPFFGQLGWFVKFAGKEIEDPRPRQKYVDEARRLLAVIDAHMAGREWVVGEEFSIADIAIVPWLNAFEFYQAREIVGWDEFANLHPYLERFFARPAVAKARNIPPREA